MPDTDVRGISFKDAFTRGEVYRIDDIPSGDPQLAGLLDGYTRWHTNNKSSLFWQRSLRYVENYLFFSGRHYYDDLMLNRISVSNTGEVSTDLKSQLQNIPKPVNDIVGRYIETNVALLTENKPKPRVEPKSDLVQDKDAALLSEFTIAYLWEALKMPAKHRELAKMILLFGTAWLEIAYDPVAPRYMMVPETRKEQVTVQPIPGGEKIPTPIEKDVELRDDQNRLVYRNEVEYGDITATIVSPFEMYTPNVHWWNGDDMGWVLREQICSKDAFIDRYSSPSKKEAGLTKANGWYLENLDKLSPETVTNLPIWWWERLSQLIEGPGSTLYVGTPEAWSEHITVRILDRKPSPKWPRGRTVIVAGGQVIYDSPKRIGARAFDPRWPNRWHPYIRYRWESMPGNMWGRSLMTKLLPKIKRINSIDVAMIMYRRTVPYAGWIAPKGASRIDDLWAGGAGQLWEWDPLRTGPSAKPEPIFPPPFPESMMKEREIQLAELEAISGTEEILRGQRPAGTTSAAMLNILRRQALSSKTGTLQEWDEGHEEEGTMMLQEVIRNIRSDPRYARRIRILAREQASQFDIQTFSGSDLSDNVQVRVDTVSEALMTKEAREARALEIANVAPQLMTLPFNVRNAIFDDLGLKKNMTPQGIDVDRARRILARIKQGDFRNLTPFVEDDPYVFFEIFKNEIKSPSFEDLEDDKQQIILAFMDQYKMEIQAREEANLRRAMMMGQIQGQGGGASPGMMGGGGQGGPG